MSVNDLLSADCICLDLKGRRRNDVLEELVDMIHATGRIQDARETVRALLEREEISSTGIGHEIAIPHAMIDGLSETILAFGRSSHGVPYKSIDGRPVRLFFVILGPVGQEYAHLQLLSRLSRFFHNQAFRTALLAAESSEEVLTTFRTEEEEEG